MGRFRKWADHWWNVGYECRRDGEPIPFRCHLAWYLDKIWWWFHRG